jgi:rubrerythrin
VTEEAYLRRHHIKTEGNDMSTNGDFTTVEILSIAIRSEIEAAELYQRMKEKTENRTLQEKFDFLIAQENKHQQILEEAYGDMFPRVDLKIPANSPVPSIRDVLEGDHSLKQLFDVAMEGEKRAENFYKDLAKKVNNPNTKSLLNYMANMERSHYVLLEVEYKQMERGEELESDDILTGERLMNLGP